ncbi:DUF3035 domain-containing protein [Shimia sp.]|jgi:hypothetical protein|uniref:DUF3035 domain-containing protein n=1 Tax=unclassified Shimia TaxID=2630038 RepID=UPI0025E2CEEA|nr:DUF3035 domain-containing protein [Shimia sp.]MCH2067236.1 DUF3035 domain-containing protein [Shimia sp.]
MKLLRLLILGVAAVGLAACSGKNTLHSNAPSGDGPDEFTIMPAKELTQPKDYAALPTPTPGGVNRTDQDPLGDAVAALGGSAAARSPYNTGIPASDGNLVNYSSRLGRDANIRATVLAEDEEFRRKRGRGTWLRISKKGLYEDVYKRQALDYRDEWWKWKRAGARTPAAPVQ